MVIQAREEQPGFWNFEIVENKEVVEDKVRKNHFAHIHPQRTIKEILNRNIIILDAAFEPKWNTGNPDFGKDGIIPTLFMEACFEEDIGMPSKIFRVMYSTQTIDKLTGEQHPGVLYRQLKDSIMPNVTPKNKVKARIIMHEPVPGVPDAKPYYYFDKY
jgi:hypothetical protein